MRTTIQHPIAATCLSSRPRRTAHWLAIACARDIPHRACRSGALWDRVLGYARKGYLMGAGSPDGSDTNVSDKVSGAAHVQDGVGGCMGVMADC